MTNAYINSGNTVCGFIQLPRPSAAASSPFSCSEVHGVADSSRLTPTGLNRIRKSARPPTSAESSGHNDAGDHLSAFSQSDLSVDAWFDLFDGFFLTLQRIEVLYFTQWVSLSKPSSPMGSSSPCVYPQPRACLYELLMDR